MGRPKLPPALKLQAGAIVLPRALWRLLRRKAKVQGCSRAALIRALIYKGLERA